MWAAQTRLAAPLFQRPSSADVVRQEDPRPREEGGWQSCSRVITIRATDANLASCRASAVARRRLRGHLEAPHQQEAAKRTRAAEARPPRRKPSRERGQAQVVGILQIDYVYTPVLGDDNANTLSFTRFAR